MNNIYFFANQVYQYGHAKPIYDKIGGVFVVNKLNRALRFKYYLRNTEITGGGIFKAPKVLKKPKNEVYDLEGVIISGSNSEIKHDKNKSISIFIGHGAGDKKFGGSGNTLETYDYHFVSGPKHIHKQKDMDIHIPEEKLIKIGYPKFDDYINGRIDKEKYYDFLNIKDCDYDGGDCCLSSDKVEIILKERERCCFLSPSHPAICRQHLNFCGCAVEKFKC